MLQQALAFNAGIRVSLLDMRSQDRLGNQIDLFLCTGSHRPPALWNRGTKGEFSVNVFLYFCHLSTKLSVCQWLFFAKRKNICFSVKNI